MSHRAPSSISGKQAIRRTFAPLKRGVTAISFIACAVMVPFAQAETGVTDTEIVFGQSTALSGPLAELGQDLAMASKAYFDYVNAHGGIHGRKIRLITLDDAYNADKAVQNVKSLIGQGSVFALFNLFGTPANTAILPFISELGIPNIAPYTGSNVVRQPNNRLVFTVRAAYSDEAAKIVEHLGMRGIYKVAVLYQAKAFGREALTYVEQALNQNQKVSASASIENDASDVMTAVDTLARSEPQAIVMITAGKASVEFIKTYRKQSPNMQFFTLSVMGTQTSVAALGKEGVGVVVSQVVPFPFSATSGIVREYQQIMRQMGVRAWSFASMEGFLNAKVAVEGLKRSGRDLTRERFLASLESMNSVDFDGYVINYRKADHKGSRYVDLTVISRDGKFLR